METLAMSVSERKRLEVFSRVRDGEVSLVKAAELLRLSYRQTKRSYGRYRAEGDRGVVHRLRGRPSNRRVDRKKQSRVLKLYQEKYADFGPTLACEYLATEDQEAVGVETLRQWLLKAGLWKQRRRRSAHRQWRERRAHLGELVQMDGSDHDWFEGRRERAVLMVMIDDATNRTYARFFEGETTAAAFDTFGRYARRWGLPRALYVDRDSIYRTTREATGAENLAELKAETQFGRALRELDVKLILAHSPQAKGRVERRNAVFQDRLVKALRRKGISDLERANEFLDETFLGELNRRFTVPARERADVHCRVSRDLKLERILAFQEQRVVQNDWTIRWQNRWFQVAEPQRRLTLRGRTITVVEQLDGTLELLWGSRKLTWTELPERPHRVEKITEPQRTGRKSHRPAADHPWRQRYQTMTPAARKTRR